MENRGRDGRAGGGRAQEQQPRATERKRKRENTRGASERKPPYQARLCSLNLRLYPAAGGGRAGSERRRAAMAAAAGQGGRGGGA